MTKVKEYFYSPINDPQPAELIKLAVGGIILIILLFSTWYVNDEYERAVVTRMGEINRVTGPGVHFKIPFLEFVHTADTRMDVIEYPTLQVATKDGQIIGVTLTMNHRINPDSDDRLYSLYKQFGQKFDYESRLLKRLGPDRMKGIFGQYAVEEIMPNREKIRTAVLTAIQADASEYGIDVIDAQVSDLQFSARFKERLESVAEMRAKAAKAEQQEREAGFLADKEVETARGRAESKEREAEAEAYKLKVEADARAHQIQVESVEKAAAIQREGEAKAIALRKQAEALKDSPGLIQFTVAEALSNWGGDVPSTVMGGDAVSTPLPFLDLTRLIGTVATSKTQEK